MRLHSVSGGGEMERKAHYEKRIAQLEAEQEQETNQAARKELGVTIETLRQTMARRFR